MHWADIRKNWRIQDGGGTQWQLFPQKSVSASWLESSDFSRFSPTPRHATLTVGYGDDHKGHSVRGIWLRQVFGGDLGVQTIRSTFVDLAIKIDGALELIIEVKAIGLDLKDNHVKQAVDYAANQGVEWVVLTNGVTWNVYRVAFKQPIEHELVFKIDFPALLPKSDDDLEMLYLRTREALVKSALGDYHAQRQALSRYFIGAVTLSEPVLDVIRRELRRLSPDVQDR